MTEAATLHATRPAHRVIVSEPLDAFPLFRLNDADEARASRADILSARAASGRSRAALRVAA